MVEDTIQVKNFVKQTKKRLLNPNIISNPFTGEFYYFKRIITVNLTPVYPNVSFLAFFIAIPILFFKLSLWLLLLTFPFLFVGFLFSNLFMYMGLSKGLRKSGYKGKIKYLRWAYVSGRNL